MAWRFGARVSGELGEDRFRGEGRRATLPAIFHAEDAEASRRAEQEVARAGGDDGREERDLLSAFITLRGEVNLKSAVG